MLTARARPDDAAARADVARAWLRLGKPDVALGWAKEAYRMKKSEEHEALVRSIARMLSQKRVEKWELAPTSLVARPTSRSLESQLNALLGGAVFKVHTQVGPIGDIEALAPTGRGKRAFLALLFASFAAGLFVAGAIVRDVRRGSQCTAMAHDLEGYLRAGALREADETLDRMRALAMETGRSRELAPLMARAEATLYRYVDQSEERKNGVELLLANGGEGTFDGVVARALITDPARLGEMQDILQAIAKEHRDPEAAFLVAVGLAARGRKKAADHAFEQAIDLEPANLPHLAHHARWLATTKRAREAEEIVDQMKTIDPESFWIDWVEEEIREGNA
jgi:tetratricopeptide (TPR) repeat protein